MEKDELYGVNEMERWELCFTASKNMENNVEILSHSTQASKVFEIEYSEGKKKQVLIKCPTDPGFYLRYKNETSQEIILGIVLTEPKSITKKKRIVAQRRSPQSF